MAAIVQGAFIHDRTGGKDATIQRITKRIMDCGQQRPIVTHAPRQTNPHPRARAGAVPAQVRQGRDYQ